MATTDTHLQSHLTDVGRKGGRLGICGQWGYTTTDWCKVVCVDCDSIITTDRGPSTITRKIVGLCMLSNV